MTGKTVSTNLTLNAVLCALGAYLIWGMSPIYFKQVSQIDVTEVLASRVIWSCVLLFAAAVVSKQLDQVAAIFRDKKLRLKLLLSSVLVACNWLIFIWAIANNRIIDASLGYYLNPLVNVAVGMLFLGERLSKVQWLALLLAVTGVAWQVFTLGRIPAISLMLAVSFGFYGLVRKKAAVAAIPGLLIETLMMLPFSLMWCAWLLHQGSLSFYFSGWNNTALLMLAGVITTTPLLLFTSAAPRLQLSTLGFLQYLAPSLTLVIGVLAYHEPFGPDRIISFGFIWLALLLFSGEALYEHRR